MLFGDLNDKVERVELKVTHNPLVNYAKMRVSAKEFAYEMFNGMIYDLQINFGTGFVGSVE